PIGSVPRFTFGSEFIAGGFPFLPVLIGIFAFAQIMSDVEKVGLPKAPEAALAVRRNLRVSHLKVIGEILGRPLLLLLSTIHGIQSGPLFVSQQPGLAYGIYAAYILAHPLMVLIIAAGTLFMFEITRVRLAVLAPVVLVLCVVGAYALNNTMQSVYVLLIF